MKINKNRIIAYFSGLFLMTIGIALSVKSNLGVSPVSSIPYSMTLITGLEMGKATIVFHVALVILQIFIMRRDFKIKNLFQIIIGIVFGYFTTFSNYLIGLFPSVDMPFTKILLSLISVIFVAVGIFLYVPSDIVPLAGEGTMQAVSDKTGFAFSNVKIAFDCSMVIISLALCLIFKGSLGSVGVGTVISAVLVGVVHKIITSKFCSKLNIFLDVDKKDDSAKVA